MAFTWLNFECYPPPPPVPPSLPHTFTPSSLVPYLHQLWTHMWFMMEAGGNVCLLLAVLHFITACTDRLALHVTPDGWREYVHTGLFVCRVPATFCILLLRTWERRLFKQHTNWRNTDQILFQNPLCLSWRPAAFTSVPHKPYSQISNFVGRWAHSHLRKQSWTCDPFLLWTE